MMQDGICIEWTNQHDVARVDVAGVDNAGVDIAGVVKCL